MDARGHGRELGVEYDRLHDILAEGLWEAKRRRAREDAKEIGGGGSGERNGPGPVNQVWKGMWTSIAPFYSGLYVSSCMVGGKYQTFCEACYRFVYSVEVRNTVLVGVSQLKKNTAVGFALGIGRQWQADTKDHQQSEHDICPLRVRTYVLYSTVNRRAAHSAPLR